MGFQYDNVPRATEVERKLNELKREGNEYTFNEIQRATTKTVDERLSSSLKPNHRFIEAYNERTKKQEIINKKEEYLNSIDENGHKLEKIYLNKEFLAIHDPLNLYKSKKNYEDLAWKVYQDVDSNNIFLKTLYYPNIRSEDYHSLVSRFSEIHRNQPMFNNISLIIAASSMFLGYFGAVKLNLKFKTTLFVSAASLGVGYYSFVLSNRQRIPRMLNKYAINVASKYPEIKFTNVEYGKINH